MNAPKNNLEPDPMIFKKILRIGRGLSIHEDNLYNFFHLTLLGKHTKTPLSIAIMTQKCSNRHLRNGDLMTQHI